MLGVETAPERFGIRLHDHDCQGRLGNTDLPFVFCVGVGDSVGNGGYDMGQSARWASDLPSCRASRRVDPRE